ncbi:MAG: primary-amine oxidase [Candidatus Sumerlaeota bacterium]|nr:primary-amine oxidase [Candidatus Sumerlaeota bacterium]
MNRIAPSLATAALLALPSMMMGGGVSWSMQDTLDASSSARTLAYFRSDDSVLCLEVEEDVWSDPRVADATRPYKCVFVDVKSPAAASTALRQGVYVVPTTLVLEGGREVGRLERLAEREATLRFLEKPETVLAQAPASAPLPAQGTRTGNSEPVFMEDSAADYSVPELNLIGLAAVEQAGRITIQIRLQSPPDAGALGRYNVYVDADDNEETGFADAKHRGADYLIQGANFYKFGGAQPTEWNWLPPRTITFNLRGQGVSYSFDRSMIAAPPDSQINIWSSTVDDSWNPVDWAPDDRRLTLGKGISLASTPQPAGPGSPPVAEATVFSDPAGDADQPQNDFVSAAVNYQGNDLRVVLEYNATPNLNGLHVMIDADADPTTGFGDGVRDGADFMVEGVSLYRHPPSAGKNWQWENPVEIPTRVIGKRVEILVPRSRAGIVYNQPIRLWFSTTDDAWAPSDWLPDSGVVKFPKQ